MAASMAAFDGESSQLQQAVLIRCCGNQRLDSLYRRGRMGLGEGATIRDRAGAFNNLHDVLETLHAAVANRVLNERTFAFGPRLHRLDQGQRRLALGEVVADGLAAFFRRRGVIQHVVNDLESDAQVTRR